MSTKKWTKAKPSRQGYYWLWINPVCDKQVVLVSPTGNVLFAGIGQRMSMFHEDLKDALWSGPLTEPKISGPLTAPR